MATKTQSNPVYYSLATGQNASMRTVVLHRRAGQDGFGVYIGEDVPAGLYVVTVDRGSPAAEANIQPGDRVLAVNGQTVTAMTTNPKDIVVKAASTAQSLTLTVQSNDIIHTLDIPSMTSSSTEEKVKSPSHQQRQPLPLFKQTFESSTDLESYIRSVLTNENLVLYPSTSTGNKEFIISTDLPTVTRHTFPSGQSHSTEHKHEGHRHRHHHHHSRRQSDRKRLVTQETQTFVKDDDVKDIPPELPPRSLKPQYPLQITTNTPTTDTKPRSSNKNTATKSQKPKPLLGKKKSNPTVLPPSPSSSDSPPASSPMASQKPLPASTAEVFSAVPSASPTNAKLSSKRETRVPSQHMIDVVEAAVRASRTGDQTKNSKQSSIQPQPLAAKQSIASAGGSNKSESDSEVPPASAQSNHHSPPPYTASSTYQAAEPVQNQESTAQGSYNVRNAQENRSGPPAMPGPNNSGNVQGNQSGPPAMPGPNNPRNPQGNQPGPPAMPGPNNFGNFQGNRSGPPAMPGPNNPRNPQENRSGPPAMPGPNNFGNPQGNRSGPPAMPGPNNFGNPQGNQPGPPAMPGPNNPRNPQENRSGPPAMPGPNNASPPRQETGVREVHLRRTGNFQGFGFHLQYNKAYYLVQRVEPGSPAEEAGLNTTDVVIRINQQITDKMEHAQFVQIVNASSEVNFLVQPVNEYLRTQPQTERDPKTARVAVPNDTEKAKSGLSRALSKLKSR